MKASPDPRSLETALRLKTVMDSAKLSGQPRPDKPQDRTEVENPHACCHQLEGQKEASPGSGSLETARSAYKKGSLGIDLQLGLLAMHSASLHSIRMLGRRAAL